MWKKSPVVLPLMALGWWGSIGIGHHLKRSGGEEDMGSIPTFGSPQEVLAASASLGSFQFLSMVRWWSRWYHLFIQQGFGMPDCARYAGMAGGRIRNAAGVFEAALRHPRPSPFLFVAQECTLRSLLDHSTIHLSEREHCPLGSSGNCRYEVQFAFSGASPNTFECLPQPQLDEN